MITSNHSAAESEFTVEWRHHPHTEQQTTFAYGRNGTVLCTGVEISVGLSYRNPTLLLNVLTSKGAVSRAVEVQIPRDKRYLDELSVVFKRLAEQAPGNTTSSTLLDELNTKWEAAKKLTRDQRSLSDYLSMSKDEFAKEYNVDPITLWLMGLETEVTLYTLANRKDDKENDRNEDKGTETTLP